MKLTLLLLIVGLQALRAADRAWTGVAGAGFEDPGNWNALPADSLTEDLVVFGPGIPVNPPRLTANRSLRSTNGPALSLVSGGSLRVCLFIILALPGTSVADPQSDIAPRCQQMLDAVWSEGNPRLAHSRGHAV